MRAAFSPADFTKSERWQLVVDALKSKKQLRKKDHTDDEVVAKVYIESIDPRTIVPFEVVRNIIKHGVN